MSQKLTEFLQRMQHSLNTQHGRFTADPLYCVFSKREIVVDADYDHDRILWWHQERHVEASDTTERRLESLRRDGRETGDWVKLAIKEIDEFVTACFTEQGCKDFLEINGHNLRKPFIYATSLYRNREMIALREAMMAGQVLPTTVVPEGWQPVPRLPTAEMRKAFHQADGDWEDGYAFDDNGNRHESPVYQWVAMLAAAPKLAPVDVASAGRAITPEHVEELVTVLQAIAQGFSDNPSHDANCLLMRLAGEVPWTGVSPSPTAPKLEGGAA